MNQHVLRCALLVTMFFAASVLGHADDEQAPPRADSHPLSLPDGQDVPVELTAEARAQPIEISIQNGRKLKPGESFGRINRFGLRFMRPGGEVSGRFRAKLVDVRGSYEERSLISLNSPAQRGDAVELAMSDRPRTMIVHLAPPLQPGAEANEEGEGQREGDKATILLRIEKWNPRNEEWEPSNQRFHVNIYESDHNGRPIPNTVVGENALRGLGEAFANVNVDPTPKAISSQATPGKFTAPDLVYAEPSQARIRAGLLEFVPLGAALMLDNPNAFAVDYDGEVVKDRDRIEIGTVQVSDGRATVEILSRDPTDPYPIAVVLQGMRIDVPKLSGGHELHYAVGGYAAGRWHSSSARLITTGTPSGYFRVVERETSAEYNVSEGAEPGTWFVGSGSYAAATSSMHSVSGYYPGLALRETEQATFGEGAIYLDPLDDFTVATDMETKVYILDPETGQHIANVFASVSLTTTATGGAKLELGRRLDPGKVEIVIGNLKLDLGTGPYDDRNFRLGIGGSASPGGATVLLVGGTKLLGGESPYGLLPNSLDFTSWTPVAGY